jgi:hypothetical protein
MRFHLILSISSSSHFICLPCVQSSSTKALNLLASPLNGYLPILR